MDKSVIKVGADIQYRYVDPILSLTIQDLNHSLRTTGGAALTSLLSVEKSKYIRSEKNYLQHRLQV